MSSSPYAKRGVLWETYKENFGRNTPILVWKASTQEMNPTIDPEFIAEEREKDPESASAEYDGNFRDDVAAFVSREAIEDCVQAGVLEVPARRGVVYTAFTDPSGGSSDSMTLAIGHMEGDRPTLDLLREVRAPFSPEAVVMEFAGTLKAYRCYEVTGDRYAGEWPRERFAVHGIQYQVAEQAKSVIYQSLLPQLNARRCSLLDNPRLVTQLTSLERRTARGGRDSIDHAPGAHDDVANAAAGCLVGVAHGPKVLTVSTDVLAVLGQR